MDGFVVTTAVLTGGVLFWGRCARALCTVPDHLELSGRHKTYSSCGTHRRSHHPGALALDVTVVVVDRWFRRDHRGSAPALVKVDGSRP